MEEEYIKERKIKELTEDERNQELLLSIADTKKSLDESHINFEYAEGRIN